MQIGEHAFSNFYAGKKGGHINLCPHIRELCYTKLGKGVRVNKNLLHKGKGQENLNMAFLHLHQPSPSK